MEHDGNLLVILVIRCVNFPDSPVATSDWQIDRKNVSFRQANSNISFTGTT